MGNVNDACNCTRKHTEKEICYTKRNRVFSCDNMVIDSKKINLFKIQNKNIIDTILHESDNYINDNTNQHKARSINNKNDKLIKTSKKNELNSRNNIELINVKHKDSSRVSKTKSRHSNKSKTNSHYKNPLLYPSLIGLSSVLEKKINGLIIQTSTTHNQINN